MLANAVDVVLCLQNIKNVQLLPVNVQVTRAYGYYVKRWVKLRHYMEFTELKLHLTGHIKCVITRERILLVQGKSIVTT